MFVTLWGHSRGNEALASEFVMSSLVFGVSSFSFFPFLFIYNTKAVAREFLSPLISVHSYSCLV